jgi:tRNA(Ile)-lysidine synthase TilS/MesJ
MLFTRRGREARRAVSDGASCRRCRGDDCYQHFAGHRLAGLAVLDADDITRPLLTKTKQELRDYTLAHRLEWVEDSTNGGDAYLRNRLRRKITTSLPYEAKRSLLNAWQRQLRLKHDIDTELATLAKERRQSRYFLTHIDPLEAGELLRRIIRDESGWELPVLKLNVR